MLQLLHESLKKSLNIHATRLKRIVLSTGSLLNGANLALSSIGRKTKGKAQPKNKIKAVDRLLGNYHLYDERLDIYKALANNVIGMLTEADVLVDWSPAGNRKNHMLRASVAFDGRAVTVYQEVHPEKLLGNYEVHKKFLRNLKRILPNDCKYNIITDAGFRTEWFELVQQQGWDFTGRLLVSTMYYELNNEWIQVKELYKSATSKPTHAGKVKLSKTRSIECDIYLYSDKVKKSKLSNEPKRKKKRKKRSGTSYNEYKKNYETPWILATSKKHNTSSPKKIVQKYSRRMKIEHDFRSTKNGKTGLGFNVYGNFDINQKPKRIAILLLLAALAMFVLWLIGLAAEFKNLHYRFQANTHKNRRVLSLVYLGTQVIEHCIELISDCDIKKAINNNLRKEEMLWA